MNKILITGANGFVGSHLIEYILNNHSDYMVCAMYRSHTSDMKNVEHIQSDRLEWVKCDLTDANDVSELFKENTYSKIFHLAAQSFVPASFTAPAHTIQANVIGTINLLEAVRKYNKDAVVMICSSSEVYGHQVHIPTVETEPFDPISPYALSKCGQDLAGTMYAKVYGLKTVITRAFTHTGSRRGDVFFASSFAKQIAKIEKGLQPNIVKVGNLESHRTIMNVKDCVRAYWLLTEHGVWGEAYNVGGIETWKVRDVLTELCNLYKGDVPLIIEVDPSLLRPKDVNMQVPDVTKLQTITNWKPEISVKDTIVELLNYWRGEFS
jgi:GDP-mannose 4,6-dehydratase